MPWLALPLILGLSACHAVATPSSFHAPALKPGEVLVTGIGAVHWRWREPANYSFTVDSRVALLTLGGQPTRVVVRDHHRVEPSGFPVADPRYLTFAEMQAHAEGAFVGGAFVAVIFAADGRPTYVHIDNPEWFDDEFTASMTDYEPQ